MIRAVLSRFRHLFSDGGPKLVRDLLALLSGQSLSRLLGFLTFAYLARTLNAEAYGALEFAISAAAFGAMVIECGVGSVAVRILAEQPERRPEIAAQVVVARLLMAVLVIPSVGIIGLLTHGSAEFVALMWLYAVALLAFAFKQDWLLQSADRMQLAAIAQPVRPLVFALGVFLFVRETTGIAAIGWIEVASALAVTVYFLWAQFTRVTPFHFSGAVAGAIPLLTRGFAVGLANIIWAAMLFVPMLFLARSHPEMSETAWLGAAQRIIISLLAASYVYHFSLYPVMARTIAVDREAWLRIITSSSHIIAWGGVGVALALTVLREWLMVFVFGATFLDGAAVLAVLAWVLPIRLQTGHARWSLIAAGNQSWLVAGELVGVFAAMIVAAVAVPPLGAVGAALSLVAGVTASGVVTQVAIDRSVGQFGLVRVSLWPVLAAAAALGLPCVLPLGHAAGMGLSAAVFAAAAVIARRPILADLHRVAYAKAHPSFTSASPMDQGRV